MNSVLPDSPLAEPSQPEEVVQSLRRIIRSVELYSKKLGTQYKITGPQLACLLAISRHQPITATQVASRIHTSASTVVGILDRLEEKGLICRERDERDRRKLHLFLTRKGTKLAADAPSPLQDKLCAGLKELSQAELNQIALALNRVVSLMEPAS